jgi:glycine/D-amino acid oxidase-like deaminating enzyme
VTAARRYEDLSLWHDQLPGSWEPRPALPADTSVDVAIVGAGYTGLWTAYHLSLLDPSLRVAVLEREVAGFGASGRNGGWCSALFPTSWHRMAKDSPRPSVVQMQAALEGSVDEVGRAAQAEGIDCHFTKGGSVALARGPAQLARAKAEVHAARVWGFGPDTLDLLSAEDASARVRATRVLGAVTTAHCAALDPARLVRGLAVAVEQRGVRVFEQTAALSVSPGQVVTTHGTVRRATPPSCRATAATSPRSTR